MLKVLPAGNLLSLGSWVQCGFLAAPFDQLKAAREWQWKSFLLGIWCDASSVPALGTSGHLSSVKVTFFQSAIIFSQRGLFLSRALLWNFFHCLPEPLVVFAVVSESLALPPSFHCEPHIHNLTARLSVLGEVLQHFLLPTPFFFLTFVVFLILLHPTQPI